MLSSELVSIAMYQFCNMQLKDEPEEHHYCEVRGQVTLCAEVEIRPIKCISILKKHIPAKSIVAIQLYIIFQSVRFYHFQPL